MTYSEAQDVAFKHIDNLRSTLFFTLAGVHSKFLALIVAPEDSTLEFRQMLYDETVKNGTPERYILSENGVLSKPMKVFIIFMQRGEEIIMAFDSYLSASNSLP